MKMIPLLLLGTLMVTSCIEIEESEKKPVIPGQSYFPLTVGNSWTFRSPAAEEEVLFYEDRIEVVRDTAINGVDYAVVQWGTDSAYLHTRLLREDVQGRIIERDTAGVERLWLDPTTPDKGSYTFPFEEGHDYDVFVSDIKSVVVLAGEFKEAKNFYFDAEMVADEEVGYTLAPGVGPVRYFGAWHYMELAEYKIVE